MMSTVEKKKIGEPIPHPASLKHVLIKLQNYRMLNV